MNSEGDLKPGIRPIPRYIVKYAHKLNVSKDVMLLSLATAVGLGGGLISVLFYYMIEYCTKLVQTLNRLIIGAEIGWGTVLFAVLGGLLVGIIIHFFAQEAKGHGVPEVMEAVARKGGRIRPRVVFVKALASTLTIGTGGSSGQEGPIVQIGSAVGSVLGQWFHMSEERIKTLVACGAAAGIAATFNAPLAGVVFALEVIIGEFTAATFSMVVVSAVVADVVAWSFLGNNPSFTVPAYELVSGWELPLYIGLGFLCALMGWLFVRTLYKTEDIFEGWKGVPQWVKPAVGGLLFGLIGWWMPLSLGTGHSVIHEALNGQLGWTLLAGLVFLKIVTTSFTLGSGGSGGVFTPSLFIGAMTGGTFGTLVHYSLPNLSASSGAYAMVGMGAAFAASTQAPITGILMIFELTRDYRIIVPLMLACVVSSIVSGWLSKETIYTLKLSRQGINLKSGKDLTVLKELQVYEAMSSQIESIKADATVGDLVRLFQQTRHTGFPVLDQDGGLIGVVTLEDVRNTEFQGRLARKVGDIMSRELVVAYPDESLADIILRFDRYDVGRLPVVQKEDRKKVIGVITRSDLLNAYNRALFLNTSVTVKENV
jgi:CIC family chloride channel protein